MKRTIATMAADILAVLTAAPLTASADPAKDYAPTYYFKPIDANVDPATGDTVVYNYDIPDEGLDMQISVYVLETSKQAWWLGPKWKSSEQLIKLKDIYDYSTNTEPFAYSFVKNGVIDNNEYGFETSHDEELNTMACSVKTGLVRKPFVPYCDPTDQYELTHFTANISKELTWGYYTIHFLTEPEDYPDQRVCDAGLILDDGSSSIRTPIVKDMTIRISGIEGDVNGDDFVDSTDASDVLAEYAALQTGGESTLDDRGRFAADTDHDRIIDSTDASNILVYYSYVMSTDEAVPFVEYFENK